jgi:hypothetical protein
MPAARQVPTPSLFSSSSSSDIAWDPSHPDVTPTSGVPGARPTGAPDPRLNSLVKLNFRFSLLQAWDKADALPTRVSQVTSLAHGGSSVGHGPRQRHTYYCAGCCILPHHRFRFPFAPRQISWQPYLAGLPYALPPRLPILGRLEGPRPPNVSYRRSSRGKFVALTSTQQKNGVRNAHIGHGRSGHLSLCPVNALVARKSPHVPRAPKARPPRQF